jgi:hypothetical protein
LYGHPGWALAIHVLKWITSGLISESLAAMPKVGTSVRPGHSQLTNDTTEEGSSKLCSPRAAALRHLHSPGHPYPLSMYAPHPTTATFFISYLPRICRLQTMRLHDRYWHAVRHAPVSSDQVITPAWYKQEITIAQCSHVVPLSENRPCLMQHEVARATFMRSEPRSPISAW